MAFAHCDHIHCELGPGVKGAGFYNCMGTCRDDSAINFVRKLAVTFGARMAQAQKVEIATRLVHQKSLKKSRDCMWDLDKLMKVAKDCGMDEKELNKLIKRAKSFEKASGRAITSVSEVEDVSDDLYMQLIDLEGRADKGEVEQVTSAASSDAKRGGKTAASGAAGLGASGTVGQAANSNGANVIDESDSVADSVDPADLALTGGAMNLTPAVRRRYRWKYNVYSDR